MHSTTERSASSTRPAVRLFSLAVLLVTLSAAVAGSAQPPSAGGPSFYVSATLFAADFPALSIESFALSPAIEGDDTLLLEMTEDTCALGLSVDFPITETIDDTVDVNTTLSGAVSTTPLARDDGGDGRATFALPDLRGRIPIHAGDGPGLSSRQLGAKSGAEKVTSNILQSAVANMQNMNTAVVGNTGGSQSHDDRPAQSSGACADASGERTGADQPPVGLGRRH